MFFGEYQHNIDKKGRISVPFRFRDELGNKMIIARGLEQKPCLSLYSPEEWKKLDETVRSMPAAKAKTVQKFLYPGASELEYDAQGRILIPQNLRDFAKLESSAYVIGMSSHIQIWNIDIWNECSADNTPENVFECISEIIL